MKRRTAMTADSPPQLLDEVCRGRFLDIFQILPPTQTEQNLEHFSYKTKYDGYRFAIGRFECPQYPYNGIICVFTNLVDDHT